MASPEIFFITGTDTGVGKTVLTAWLTRHLVEQGTNVMALKPFCSGGREDARMLRLAMDQSVSLDAVNPWHFRAPLTPLLAARKDGRTIAKDDVLKFVRDAARQCDHLLIEGAGGLLSPLGEGFDALDLMKKVRCRPVVVCPNRLGAINQILLVKSALPTNLKKRAVWVLMAAKRETLATRTNVLMLQEFLGPRRLIPLPRVNDPFKLSSSSNKLPARIRRELKRVLDPVTDR